MHRPSVPLQIYLISKEGTHAYPCTEEELEEEPEPGTRAGRGRIEWVDTAQLVARVVDRRENS